MGLQKYRETQRPAAAIEINQPSSTFKRASYYPIV